MPSPVNPYGVTRAVQLDRLRNVRTDLAVKKTSSPRGRSSIKISGNTPVMVKEPAGKVEIKPEKTQPAGKSERSEEKSFSLFDLLDVINPLHHIPIIGSLYRSVSGDEIKAPARIFGGGIFGGLIGALSGLVNALFSEATGKDIGEHLLAFFGGSGEKNLAAAKVENPNAVDGTTVQRSPHSMDTQPHAPSPDTEGENQTIFPVTGARLPTPHSFHQPIEVKDHIMRLALDHYQQVSQAEMVVPDADTEKSESRLDLFS